METFTKGWWYERCGGKARQRTVGEMALHSRELGAGGNCFDLAVWLRHELDQVGVEARIVGHGFETPDAHVALVAEGEGGDLFLCDLGDLWLELILITSESPAFSPDWHRGFFPGREVRVESEGERLTIAYRHSGKIGRQDHDLSGVSEEAFRRACNH